MGLHNSNLVNLVEKVIGVKGASRVIELMTIPRGFAIWESDWASRKELAQALNMVLFFDVLMRVPAGRQYTEQGAAQGGQVFHEHRALPPGECAFTRILEALGYRLDDTFPQARSGMTGRSYVLQDSPDEIARFFVIELHPQRSSKKFQATCALSSSKDPLSPKAQCLLHALARDGRLRFVEAVNLLLELKACFARQHEHVFSKLSVNFQNATRSFDFPAKSVGCSRY